VILIEDTGNVSPDPAFLASDTPVVLKKQKNYLREVFNDINVSQS